MLWMDKLELMAARLPWNIENPATRAGTASITGLIAMYKSSTTLYISNWLDCVSVMISIY